MYNIEPFIEQGYDYDDILLKFNTYDELVALLGEEKSGNFDKVVEDMSYKKFANDILKTIREDL